MADEGGPRMLDEVGSALGLEPPTLETIEVHGEGRHPSCFPVSDLAVASIGAAGAALADLHGVTGPVAVDRRLAAWWFTWSIDPVGWEIPGPWDAIAGDYEAGDGWIKLHTNTPAHRVAALAVLGCEPTREAVAAAVRGWRAEDLETAVVDAGGCAARLRTIDAWAGHPQGAAVATEPLVRWDRVVASRIDRLAPTPDRPLRGLRVLDLTRVLAGPVATRFLAGYGAEVLRVDPPDWDEPGVIPEVTLGKRCTRLDLRADADRAAFAELLAGADVLVHGYRSDALEGLGFGDAERQRFRPGLVDVSLDAYGHTGPWARRRGFDSLVQFSSGIAAEGMTWRGAEVPVSLPVQALDHATGYLIAAAVLRAITSAVRDGTTERARLSLARTAKLLVDHRGAPDDGPIDALGDGDYGSEPEATAWGPARRLRPPLTVPGAAMRWDRGATALGSSRPTWDVQQ